MVTEAAKGQDVKFGSLTPAGGEFPRHMSLSPCGTMIAVALQNSGRVAVYGRDRKTGKVGEKVLAQVEGLGGVTSVVWDDHHNMMGGEGA